MVGWEGTPWNVIHKFGIQNVDGILAQDVGPLTSRIRVDRGKDDLNGS